MAAAACMNKYLYCTSIEKSDSKGKFTVSCFDLEGLLFSYKPRNHIVCD